MSELTGNTEVKMGSERSFGIVFAIVFLLIALFPLLGDGGVRLWSAGVSAVFGGLAFLAPELLAPLNTLWFKFGMLLSKIMSPSVMGILFFVTVTPTGLFMRARGKDLLRQKLDPDAETYWIEVDPEQAALTSMKKQF
ncbi:MAG: SxtJ family membrane protein [Paracoccaceae bacterium]|nr:SxtJ family membrane protein [Paracoccaceae bacterium]